MPDSVPEGVGSTPSLLTEHLHAGGSEANRRRKATISSHSPGPRSEPGTTIIGRNHRVSHARKGYVSRALVARRDGLGPRIGLEPDGFCWFQVTGRSQMFTRPPGVAVCEWGGDPLRVEMVVGVTTRITGRKSECPNGIRFVSAPRPAGGMKRIQTALDSFHSNPVLMGWNESDSGHIQRWNIRFRFASAVFASAIRSKHRGTNSVLRGRFEVIGRW